MVISKEHWYQYEEEATRFAFDFASCCKELTEDKKVLLKNYLNRYYGSTYFKYDNIMQRHILAISQIQSKKLARIAALKYPHHFIFRQSSDTYKWILFETLVLHPELLKYSLELFSFIMALRKQQVKRGVDVLFVVQCDVHLRIIHKIMNILRNKSISTSIATTDIGLLKVADAFPNIFFFYSMPKCSPIPKLETGYQIWIDRYRDLYPQHGNLVSSTYFDRALQSLLYIMEYRIWQANNLVTTTRPKVIVTLEESGRFSNSIAVAAKQNGIKTINISHGLFAAVPGLRDDTLFDSFLLYGQSSVDNLEKQKYVMKKSDYIPIGACRYDQLYELKQSLDFGKREAYWQSKGLSVKNRKVLLYVSTYFLETRETEQKVLKILFGDILKEVATKRDDLLIVVKKHPGDKSSFDQDQFRDCDNIVVFESSQLDLYESLYYSDIVVNMNSGAGLEAICLDKKMLIFSPTSAGSDLHKFAEYGAALVATDYDTFCNATDQLIRDTSNDLLKSGRNKYLEDHLFKFDGLASTRAASHILHQLDNLN